MPEAFERIESYYAGAYWGPRKETPEACARRAEVFLASIASIDPAFSRWFEGGRSRKDALKRPIEPSGEALAKRVRRGKDRQFEALGYSVWAWNGSSDDDDATSFNFNCGGDGVGQANRCVVELPTRGLNAERILSEPVLTELVRSMVLAWEPESAIATSSMLREAVTPTGRAGTFVGWVMYLPHSQAMIPLLPSPVRMEPVEDKGTLIILTSERLTTAKPEHVELGRCVHELLNKAGLLRPVVS